MSEVAAGIDGVASALFSAGTVAGTLQQVVDTAASTIDGCDLAGIFIVAAGEVATLTHSDPSIVEIDALQRETDEGPCLDALATGTAVYARDLIDDARYPRYGPRAAAAGMRSVLAFPLQLEDTRGALNLYARLPDAYGATDRAKGAILTALAAVAVGSAVERHDDEERLANLQNALQTRDIIGQAKGILMERERITAEQAFDMLRRASQHLNEKLRDVAQGIVDTGDLPVRHSRASHHTR
jgi:hypothetical protein